MLSESEIQKQEQQLRMHIENVKFDAATLHRRVDGHDWIASRLESLARQYRLLAREIAADESGTVKR